MTFDNSKFNRENYDLTFLKKLAEIKTDFAEFAPPKLEAFKSDYKNYRYRAEFRIWHQDEDIFHIMFDASASSNKPKQVRLDTFLPASKIINKAMQEIIPELKFNEILRKKLFQIDYLSSLTGDVLVSLIYHKKLDDSWLCEAQKLSKKLGVKIVGRSRKQKLSLSDDFIIEKMQVANKELILKQIENSFTQPNAEIAQKMLNWIYAKTQSMSDKLKNTDLLELYSGNSFFSLALSENFKKILNVEVSSSGTNAANFNISANNCNNIKALNAKSEEISELLSASRLFENTENTEKEKAKSNEGMEKAKKRLALKLESQSVKLDDYNFSSVLVDPPRKGLDDLTLSQVSKFDNIFYISCNPETLKTNLKELCKTHNIKDMAFFDQFPYTHHKEIGTILTKK